MNPKRLLWLSLAVVMVGCSKKEETPVPPSTQPVASTPPASAGDAGKTALKTPPPQQAATNAQGPIPSTAGDVMASANPIKPGATNAAQIPPASTNAKAQNALSMLGGALNPSSTNGAIVPASARTPAGQGATPLSLAALSSDQVTQGLKEALGKGLQHAVASLGQPGGFLTNVNVKIPLPDKLQSVEKTLRSLGQGQLADQCITTMNQAAEQAVPAAADVFVNTLKNMTVDDAKGILNGPADAATQFFRHATEAELTQKFLPIVRSAMAKCGTTAAYDQVMDKAKIASPFFSNPSFDLEAYVTSKAMDGLFKMVADEEKNIRQNPLARSTDLLKSVFGAIQK